MTLNKIIAKYMLVAPYKNYIYRLNKFSFLFGDRDIRDVGRPDMDKFESILKIRYKLTTVRDNLTVVKTFLNWAFANGYSKYNPRYFKIPKVLSRRVVTQWDEYEKMCSLLNPSEFHGLQMLLIMKFLAMGLRCGEVSKLNISDFNNIGPATMFAIIQSEKSKRERIISWCKDTHDLLIKYLGVRICLNKDDWLFGSSDGGKRRRITNRTIQRWFSQLKSQAGVIRPITPHSVRHMAAHLARDRGADVKTIQIKLGHSHLSSTDSYLQLDPMESVRTLSRYKLV